MVVMRMLFLCAISTMSFGTFVHAQPFIAVQKTFSISDIPSTKEASLRPKDKDYSVPMKIVTEENLHTMCEGIEKWTAATVIDGCFSKGVSLRRMIVIKYRF